jgi:hypothetical protein
MKKSRAKLTQLAAAAAEFFETRDLLLRTQPEDAHTKYVRHVCQFLARDAGISPLAISRFWGMDRTSVYYGCKMVRNRISSSPEAKAELLKFMAFARKNYFTTKAE